METGSPQFRVLAYAGALGIAALSIVLLVEGRALLIPFAVAVMVWFLINALANGIGRIRIGDLTLPGWLRLTLAFLAVLGSAALVINMAGHSFSAVVDEAPAYQQRLEVLLTDVSQGLGLEGTLSLAQLADNIEITPLIGSLASALANLAGNAGLVLIYLLFLILEQNTIEPKIRALFPSEERRARMQGIMKQIGTDIRKYVWIKTVMSIMTGGLSYVVLVAVGVDYAAFWSIIIFMLNYIPTIGSLLGIIFPSLLTLVQFDTITPFLIVTPILTAIQVVIGNVLEPKVMGGSLNLSALVVLLSLAVWGSLWGVAGMFLSVPIMVMLVIIFANFDQTRPIAVLLSANGDVKGFHHA